MQIEIKGHKILVDEHFIPIINQFTWQIEKRPRRTTQYAVTYVKVGGKQVNISMHRLLMGLPTLQVDHINGNGLDNRLANLRKCRPGQNRQNTGGMRTGKSKFKGVHWHEKNQIWQSKIKHKNKTEYLGSFKNEIDAALAYDKAALRIHGPQFVRLNFPGDRPKTSPRMKAAIEAFLRS